MGLKSIIANILGMVPKEIVQRLEEELKQSKAYLRVREVEIQQLKEDKSDLSRNLDEVLIENDSHTKQINSLEKEIGKIKKEVNSPKHYFEYSPDKIDSYIAEDHSIFAEIKRVISNEIIDEANNILQERDPDNFNKYQRNLYVAHVKNDKGNFYSEIHGGLPKCVLQKDDQSSLERKAFYEAISVAADGRFNLPITQTPLEVEKTQLTKDIANYKVIKCNEDPILAEAEKRIENRRKMSAEIEL